MDKGIRVNVNNKFVELLPMIAEVGYTRFRAEVNAYAMEEFNIGITAAASHFNYARKKALMVPEYAALLEGKMRPADKLGGRKRKVAVVAVAEDAPEQTVFSVYAKGTGQLVAEGMSFEAATGLVAKARAAKKATLYWV